VTYFWLNGEQFFDSKQLFQHAKISGHRVMNKTFKMWQIKEANTQTALRKTRKGLSNENWEASVKVQAERDE